MTFSHYSICFRYCNKCCQHVCVCVCAFGISYCLPRRSDNNANHGNILIRRSLKFTALTKYVQLWNIALEARSTCSYALACSVLYGHTSTCRVLRFLRLSLDIHPHCSAHNGVATVLSKWSFSSAASALNFGRLWTLSEAYCKLVALGPKTFCQPQSKVYLSSCNFPLHIVFDFSRLQFYVGLSFVAT